MATLREIIEYSKSNPNTEYAKKAYQQIVNGAFDVQARREGIDLSWAGRQSYTPEQNAKISQLQQQAQQAEVEAKKIASPFGQLKEGVKAFGETTGITPTARKIAAGVAPYLVSKEELPAVVDELAGGVNQKKKMGELGESLNKIGVNENVAEGIQIALDLPLISLGLSKTISQQIGKQIPKLGSKAATSLLEKELVDFLPLALKRVLDTDITTPIRETAGDVAGKAKELGQNINMGLFGKQTAVKNIDDVIKQADQSLKPAQVLEKAEQASAKPSLLQKWAGVSPDIKNRISGKQEKLKEYFDVAHARNNFDTLPTPLEYGAKNVDTALSKMEGILNDTGSQIGKFRKKVSTYKASIDRVNKVEKTFNDELSKLNLEIKNGKIKQKPGTVRRVNSDSEIKALTELFSDLQTVKQSPDLERLIDLRNLFDSKINFAKSSRDVSSALDPLSRNIRKQIADTAAEIVGKSEAANLKKYSEFIDAFNELKSYTDRKAGAEFLLKQVLSERGRSPREVIQIIKEFTDIDLMDDAVMSSLATDLIGNTRQKGLFRQEITKAGLDAQAILRGDTKGAVDLMFNFLKRGLINEEKQFLKAAK